MIFNFVYKTYEEEIERLKVDQKPVGPLWGGRVLCVYRGGLHALSVALKPILYAILTIAYTILFLKNHKSEHKKQIRAFFISTFAAPCVELFLFLRAIKGILKPDAYFNLTLANAASKLCTFKTKFYFNSYLLKTNLHFLWRGKSFPFFYYVQDDLKKISLAIKKEKVPDDRIKTAINDLIDSSNNCPPRWHEEAYRIWITIHEPANLDDRIPFYIECLISEIFYSMATIHVNDVNTFRRSIGHIIGLDQKTLEIGNNDPYSYFSNNNRYHLMIFSKGFQKATIIEYVGGRINADYNVALRAHLFQKLLQQDNVDIDDIAAMEEKAALYKKGNLLTEKSIETLTAKWIAKSIEIKALVDKK